MEVKEVMLRKLKADLHIHSRANHSSKPAKCNSFAIIDRAAELGYEVLAITDHDVVTYNQYLAGYAQERGILLIPGLERTIEGRHVLLYNFDFSRGTFDTFDSIKRYKRSDTLVIAPHPFFPGGHSLHYRLEENLGLFDAIELSHFYTKKIDFNKLAVEKARQYNLPLVGNSDTHFLFQMGTTYSLIEAEKDIESVIRAVKLSRVEVVSQPLNLIRFSHINLFMLLDCLSHLVPVTEPPDPADQQIDLSDQEYQRSPL